MMLAGLGLLGLLTGRRLWDWTTELEKPEMMASLVSRLDLAKPGLF
jgi:hypothetical protein